MLEEIRKLIRTGESIPHDRIHNGFIMKCTDTDFVKWLSEIQIFASNNLKSHPLYNNISHICLHKMNTGYDEMLGILKALEDDFSKTNDLVQKDVVKMKTIDELITALCDLHNYPGIINLQCMPYVKFKNDLTEFIIAHNLQNTVEWRSIKANLVTTPLQHMVAEEIDIILSHLQSLQKKMFEDQYYKKSHNESNSYSTNRIPEGVHAAIQTLIPGLKSVTKVNKTMEIESKVIEKNNTIKKVFIVHGHDELAKIDTARFIEKLGFNPIILHEQVNRGQTIIEKIEANTDVDFAIVLYTPCDVGGKNEKELTKRARQNVVFEHGYLIAKLGRENVVALVKEDVEFPSDISGVVYETMDDKGAWKLAVAKELRAAGFNVDFNKI